MSATARKPKKDVITDVELAKLQREQTMLAKLKREIGQLQKAVEGEEQAMMDRLKNGATIQRSSTLTAVIQELPGDCRPKWKEEYLTHFALEHGTPPEQTEALVRARTTVLPVESLVIGPRL